MELKQDSREAQQTNIYNDNRVQVLNIHKQPIETRVVYQTTADYDALAAKYEELQKYYAESIERYIRLVADNIDVSREVTKAQKMAVEFMLMAQKAEAENKELKKQLKALTQGNINGDTVEL